MTKTRTALTWLFWSAAALVLIWGVLRLEGDRASVQSRVVQTEAGAITLYDTGAAGPLVVVAHGFAGSVQLMQTISRDLARAGFTVAAFDFFGHGRSPARMSADITRIEGTTLQLAAQTRDVITAARKITGHTGPAAVIGHSMATDIIIRAQADLPDIAATVAISMYSDAVTATFPNRLLILSGEWEHRLRDLALQDVRLVDPTAREGVTVQNGPVKRRTSFAPGTEHTAVLFSPVTLNEIRTWLGDALDHTARTAPRANGAAILGVLIALPILIFPLARLLARSAPAPTPMPARLFWAVTLLPAPVAALASGLVGGTIFGTAAFGHLVVFFGVWGGVALAVLMRAGMRPKTVNARGLALLLGWGLVFALALDRYGAAFLPTGPRILLMAALACGTLPFLLAERLVVHRAALWQRIVLRAVPIVTLVTTMLIWPETLGLSFTVLPVLLLFYAVFGTMGHAVARRTGPETAGLGLGLCLAWALAASTPLFAG